MEKAIKNKLAKLIANKLHWRVMYFVIIRCWAYTTTHECSNKTPDQTTWSEVIDSWGKKTNIKV